MAARRIFEDAVLDSITRIAGGEHRLMEDGEFRRRHERVGAGFDRLPSPDRDRLKMRHRGGRRAGDARADEVIE